MNIKCSIRSFCHRLIQYLNILLFASGVVMSMVAITLSLLVISKRLYLLEDRAMWSLVMLVALGVAIINIFLELVVLILSRVTKFEGVWHPSEGLRRYVKIEVYTVLVLMGITMFSFDYYTGGCDFSTFQGDHWWVVATKMPWRISMCTSVLRAIQLITWDRGSKR